MNDLKLLENDLVPVYETSEGKQVVYGSDLHRVLEVKSKYRDWSRNRLTDCDAVENVDYEEAKILAPSGQTKVDHIILLDTAKEMAMLERNEQGKKVRRYFIEIEKKYKDAKFNTPMSQLEIARMSLDMLIEQERKMKDLESRQEETEKKQNELDGKIKKIGAKIEKHQEDWYTVAGYASLIGMDVGLNSAGKLGKKASAMCKKNNIKIDKTSDPRFGKVNVYPRWILEKVFEELD